MNPFAKGPTSRTQPQESSAAQARIVLGIVLIGVVALFASITFVGLNQGRALNDIERFDDATRTLGFELRRQDAALYAYQVSARPSVLRDFEEAGTAFSVALATIADGPDGEVFAQRIRTAYERWDDYAREEINQIAEDGPEIAGTGGRTTAAIDGEVRERRGLVNAVLVSTEFAHEEAGGRLDALVSDARRVPLMITALIALVFGSIVGFLVYRQVRRTGMANLHEARYRRGQSEFSDAMQAVRDETEAHRLLERHVERSVQIDEAIVLVRNNSADRLQPSRELPESSDLREPLDSARPDSCLAVRLGRSHGHDPERPALMSCELCGRGATRASCTPLVVGGEVIGSVLSRGGHEVDTRHELRVVRESVRQAAPVLANLRNLELAEGRARTDSLTGLANKRAVASTMKRMLAHAARSGSPMSAVMMDLDRFKKINDTYGHEAGDAVLAAVGAVLLHGRVRDSDFVARFGGEEFLLLLPETDAESAATLAQNLRRTLGTISVEGVDQKVTASFGIAEFPLHSNDAEGLLRAADRALYAAKAAGRDRYRIAETGVELPPGDDESPFLDPADLRGAAAMGPALS